jgi:hypothetical protein
LEVPIINVDGAWIVDDKTNIHIDESHRPYLASLRLLQEWLLCRFASEPPVAPLVLPQGLAPTNSPSFTGLTTTGAMQIAITTVTNDLTLDETHHCVICANSILLTLPDSASTNTGRVYIVKSQKDTVKIAGNIDGADTTIAVAAGKAVTLVSDGKNTWHTISALA